MQDLMTIETTRANRRRDQLIAQIKGRYRTGSPEYREAMAQIERQYGQDLESARERIEAPVRARERLETVPITSTRPPEGSPEGYTVVLQPVPAGQGPVVFTRDEPPRRQTVPVQRSIVPTPIVAVAPTGINANPSIRQATVALAEQQQSQGWESVSESSELEMGYVYRLSQWIVSPPPANEAEQARLQQKIVDAVAARGANVEVTKVEYSGIGSGLRIGRFDPWTLHVYFRKTGPGTPVLIVIGAIVVSLLALTLAARSLTRIVEKATEPLKPSPLTPAILLGVVVIGVLFLRR